MSGITWDKVLEVALVAIPIIVAITFHEAAHGYVARAFGDNTAAEQGRITLNPLRHIDPFGTVILPALLYFTTGMAFGFAKPVPVDFGRLRHPKQDMIWVAAAGPGMNIVLAAISGLLLYADVHWIGSELLGALFFASLEVNLVLAVFNLWPIPPLDGSKVAIGLLPPGPAYALARLDRLGPLFVLGILLLSRFAGFNILQWMVGRPVAWLERPILSLIGLPTG